MLSREFSHKGEIPPVIPTKREFERMGYHVLAEMISSSASEYRGYGRPKKSIKKTAMPYVEEILMRAQAEAILPKNYPCMSEKENQGLLIALLGHDFLDKSAGDIRLFLKRESEIHVGGYLQPAR